MLLLKNAQLWYLNYAIGGLMGIVKFKELTFKQKKDLLRNEYLKDGADESIVDELIPDGDLMTVSGIINNRLRDVFSYRDDTEVEV
jgi:hypothetical protein